MYAALYLACALAAQPVREVEPLNVFYMADFHDPAFMTMLPIPRGRLSARELQPPYNAIITAEQTYVNGALALDPVRGILYGNRCCVSGATIQAHDARTLELLPQKGFSFETSGWLSIELDPLRRVLFVYDGKDVRLTAVSIAPENYGQKIAEITPPQLLPDAFGSSADAMAVFGKRSRLFLTGADGGPVLAIDISGIYPSGGTFGEVVVTAQTARVSGNSGGALAIDEVNERVFVIPEHGIVRAFEANPEYRRIKDYPIPQMSYGDCGLFYDGRNETLYVGREVWQGVPQRPIALDKDGTLREIPPTPFDGTDLTFYGGSFAGATGPFVERSELQPSEEAIAVREDRVECRCVQTEKDRPLALALIFPALLLFRRARAKR